MLAGTGHQRQAPTSQHTPLASSMVSQQLPCTSMCLPLPPHTPQASSTPAAQHSPRASSTAPGGQHAPVALTTPEAQHCSCESTMPPAHPEGTSQYCPLNSEAGSQAQAPAVQVPRPKHEVLEQKSHARVLQRCVVGGLPPGHCLASTCLPPLSTQTTLRDCWPPAGGPLPRGGGAHARVGPVCANLACAFPASRRTGWDVHACQQLHLPTATRTSARRVAGLPVADAPRVALAGAGVAGRLRRAGVGIAGHASRGGAGGGALRVAATARGGAGAPGSVRPVRSVAGGHTRGEETTGVSRPGRDAREPNHPRVTTASTPALCTPPLLTCKRACWTGVMPRGTGLGPPASRRARCRTPRASATRCRTRRSRHPSLPTPAWCSVGPHPPGCQSHRHQRRRRAAESARRG